MLLVGTSLRHSLIMSIRVPEAEIGSQALIMRTHQHIKCLGSCHTCELLALVKLRSHSHEQRAAGTRALSAAAAGSHHRALEWWPLEWWPLEWWPLNLSPLLHAAWAASAQSSS